MSNFKKAVSILLALTMILSVFSMVAFADETDPTAAPADAAQAEATAAPDAAEATAAPEADAAAQGGDVVTTTTDQEAAEAVVGSTTAATMVSLPNDDVQFAQDYKFDYGIGLFEMLPDGYWQTEQVTRADFATIVAKMLKANTAGYPRYGQTPYSDVDETDPAYPAICYLTEVGILQGDGNSIFRPNDPIIVNEASKMIMCALGYQRACDVTNGGYPDGYTSFALRQGIYNGLSLSYTNSLNAMQMSRMVRNAMEAYIMDTITYDSNGGQIQIIQSTKTLLSETYKMYTARGVVQGTYYSYLGNAEVQLENEVVISDVYAYNDTISESNQITYQFSDSLDMESYVGYAVNFYYMKDVSGYRRNYIAYFEPRDSYNTVYDIDAKNITSLTSESLSYEDGNGRIRTIDVSNAAVSYNGVATTTKLTSEPLSIKQGHVKVICHNMTSSADVLLIEAQRDGLFERYNKSTYQVIFQTNMTGNDALPPVYFDEAYHTRLTLNGKDIEPEDLKKNDVLTVAVSEDGKYITAYVSRDILEDAMVQSKYTDSYANGEKYTALVINDQTYYQSRDLSKDITPGFSSDFQLTYDGRIAGTNAAGTGGGNYGYLIDFSDGQGTFDSRFLVKILDMNGDIKVYRSASKVLTNIVEGGLQRVSCDNDIFKQVFATPQLVTFEVNSNDEIRTLYYAPDYTATLPASTDSFGKYFTGTTPYANHLMQTCAITNDTVIFSVPYEDRDRDEDYSRLTIEDLTDDSYTVDIYDIRNGIANVLVVKDVNPSSLSNTAGVMLVEDIIESWDADQQMSIYEILGWTGGEQKSVKIEPGYAPNVQSPFSYTAGGDQSEVVSSFMDLKPGDVIQYNTTANGYLNSFRLLFSYTNRIEKGGAYGEWNEDGVADKYKIESGEDIRTIFAEVTSSYDFFMIATSRFDDMKWYRTYPTDGTEIYVYDKARDEFRAGEAFDVEIGDKVFVKVNNGNEKYMIVVYK